MENYLIEMWEKVVTFFEQAGIQVSHLLIGGFATAWVVSRQGKGSILKGVISVVAGAISTALISPFVIDYLSVHQKGAEYALVFLVGIVGMNLINSIIEHAPAFFKKVFEGAGDIVVNLLKKKSDE